MAHADPTSSPGAPSVRRCIEKYQLIDVAADHTSSTAGSRRAMGRAQHDADPAEARERDPRPAATQRDRHDGEREERGDVDDEHARRARPLDDCAGDEDGDDEGSGAPGTYASVS